jgi:hypothetical protein
MKQCILLLFLSNYLAINLPTLQPPVPRLIALEFVQLDEQIIHILQVLDLIDLLELIDEGEAGDVEDVYFDLELVAEELYGSGLVVVSIEDIEVDVPEVDDE